MRVRVDIGEHDQATDPITRQCGKHALEIARCARLVRADRDAERVLPLDDRAVQTSARHPGVGIEQDPDPTCGRHELAHDLQPLGDEFPGPRLPEGHLAHFISDAIDGLDPLARHPVPCHREAAISELPLARPQSIDGFSQWTSRR